MRQCDHYVNVVDRGVMVALDGVMGLFVSIMDLALMLIGIIVTVLEVQFLTVLNLINDECGYIMPDFW